MLNTWTIQNCIVFILLMLTAYCAHRMKRSEYWRNASREIRRSRLNCICFFIVCLYLAVALLDSVGWRNQMFDQNGAPLVSAETGKPILDAGMSVLDRLLTPLRNIKENAYSAPLSDVQYTKTTITNDKGIPQRIYQPLKHPKTHVLGTDRIGVDVLYQSLKSIRTGIIIGLLTTLIAVPFALLAGIVAGYFGGWIDDLIQYAYTVVNAIPTILFIAAFIVIFGTGLPQLCIAMGLASWTSLCRLLRAETMKLREMEFVQASKAIGSSSWFILFKHILPNVMHIVVITMVLRFSTEILSEAVLTYLGIGVDANTMSWGTMINDARSELTRDPIIWWKLAAAFIFMFGLVLPANIFGDAVRDALDPRLSKRN